MGCIQEGKEGEGSGWIRDEKAWENREQKIKTVGHM